MLIDWTRNIKDPKDKADFERTVFGSKRLLNRLKEILDDKERSLDRSETSIENYNTPNWSERQAHKNGNREMLHYLKTLIDLDQQQSPTLEK